MRKSQSGFTLIELSIVLPVLIFVSMIVYNEMRQQRIDSAAEQQGLRIAELFQKQRKGISSHLRAITQLHLLTSHHRFRY